MLPIWIHETCPNPLLMVKKSWASNMDSNLNLIHIFVEIVINYKKREIESSSLILDN
jgi:hypothetical protein